MTDHICTAADNVDEHEVRLNSDQPLTASKAPSLVLRQLADLKPYDRNARTHSEAQVAQIAGSISEFGFTNPILIDENNTVLAGAGRVMAATKLKRQEVPCVLLAGLSDAQKAAYVLADNKLALNASWDDGALQEELMRLADLGFETTLTGFSEVEFAELLDAISTNQDDFEFELPGPPPEDALAVPRSSQVKPVDASPTDASQHWKGMPEFNQPDAGPFRTVKVHFKDQAAVDAFAKLIGSKLTDKTKFIWFPRAVDPVPAVAYG